MKVSELLDMLPPDMYAWIGNRWDMPAHYVESFFDKADELGLDPRQALRALAFARSIVGTDLDSWIYGEDMAEYVELVLG